MTDSQASDDDLLELVDIVRLALAAHVAAEACVARTVLERSYAPPALRMIIAQASAEHLAQRHATNELANMQPRSCAWNERVTDLRALLADHTERATLTRWTLLDHVPDAMDPSYAREYATQHLLALTMPSPWMFAHARLDALAAALDDAAFDHAPQPQRPLRAQRTMRPQRPSYPRLRYT